MRETYGLREYINIIWRQKITVMAVTLIIMSIGAAFSFFLIEPVYESGTTLMINRIENETERYLDFDDVVLNQKLVNTYGKLAKSDAVMKKSMQKLNISMDIEEFKKNVSVTIYPDTEIIEISVLNKNARDAARIANDLASSFIDEIKD
jgi:Capsular polysaccharide biosynthesis protein